MCFWIQHMGFRLRTVFTIRPSSPLSLTPTLSQRERGLIDVFWIQRMGFRLPTVLAIPPSSPLSLWERARVRAGDRPFPDLCGTRLGLCRAYCGVRGGLPIVRRR